jgi:anti-sigma-K factor RskA
MIEGHQEELASLYVFDLLEGPERDQFETALSRDGELRSLVRDLKETACSLAFTIPPAVPPLALKDRVLNSVGAVAPAGESNIIRPDPSVWRLAPWAIAACLTVVSAWLGQRYASTRTELATVRTQAELVAVSLQSTQQQLEAERILGERRGKDAEQRIAQLASDLKSQGDLATLKITALASMLQNLPQAQAIAVWDPRRQEGILDVQKLPALAANEDYQIWVVDPQYPIPVDGGVFTVEPASGSSRVKFTAKQPVSVINAFAVTRERKGGVPKAEGPFVLLGK